MDHHLADISGFDKWSNRPYITGGGLGAKYSLAKFHFHWRMGRGDGSEHTVNGVHYSSEVLPLILVFNLANRDSRILGFKKAGTFVQKTDFFKIKKTEKILI